MTVIPPDMQAELDNFDKECDARLAEFVQILEDEKPPSILYHYTNDVGLKGILEHGSLWLTDAFSLNDPAELRHGFSHAIDTLNQRAASGPRERKIFAKQFERFSIDKGVEEAAHFFVGCFSASGDDLGQWRAYADNGRGFALGFDTALLENGFVKSSDLPTGSGHTFKVVYNDKTAIRLQERIIDKALRLILLPHGKKFDANTLREYRREVLITTCMHCLQASLFFKHEAYSSEAEYRFLQIHMAGPHAPPVVKYRARPYGLVRYREYDWRTAASSALTKIVVGPAADKMNATLFAKDCLRAFHPASPVDVVPSLIPYRS